MHLNTLLIWLRKLQLSFCLCWYYLLQEDPFCLLQWFWKVYTLTSYFISSLWSLYEYKIVLLFYSTKAKTHIGITWDLAVKMWKHCFLITTNNFWIWIEDICRSEEIWCCIYILLKIKGLWLFNYRD